MGNAQSSGDLVDAVRGVGKAYEQYADIIENNSIEPSDLLGESAHMPPCYITHS